MTVEEVTAHLLFLATSVVSCDDQTQIRSALATADVLLACVVADARIDVCLGTLEASRSHSGRAVGSLEDVVQEIVERTPAGWAYQRVRSLADRHAM